MELRRKGIARTLTPAPSLFAYCLSTGVLQKHCNDAFMKQVLPRLHRPTNPSEDGHTSAEEPLGFMTLGLESSPRWCAALPRGHSSVLASRSSMKSRCPSTFTVQWSIANASRKLAGFANQLTNQPSS